MTKQTDQTISPGVKPDPQWSGSRDEMMALLDGCDFKLATKGQRIPPADFRRVVDAAETYQETHQVPDRQAVTMACTAYWKLFERRG